MINNKKIRREKKFYVDDGKILFALILFSLVIISITDIIADLTITTPSNNQITFSTDITPQVIDGNYHYTLKDGDSLTVKYGTGFISEYKILKSSSAGQPRLVFDSVGRLTEADFKTGSDGNYVFGNEQISLLAGTEVHFKEGKVNIKLPNEKMPTNLPFSVNNKSGESIFEFLSSNNKFSIGDNVFTGEKLKFENGNLFFDFKGNAKLNTLDIINENGIKTYIDFKGEVNKGYKGAYISIDDKKGIFVTGSNINKRGVKINFDKNNPYGLRILDNDHFAVWSLGNSDGAYVRIVNRINQNRVPVMDTLNQFIINFDERSAHYNADLQNLYFSPEVLLDGFQTGKTTSAIEILSFKGSFDKIEPVSSEDGKPSILGIIPEAWWAYGTNPEFIKTDIGYPEFSSVKRGFSNSWLYYNVNTVDDFHNLFGNKVRLHDTRGTANSQNLGYLRDVLASLPSRYWDEVGTLHIYNNRGGGNGLGGNGQVELNIDSRGTIVHELGHEIHMHLPREGGIREEFDNLWKSVRSSRGGFVSGYAGTWRWGEGVPYEDIAETHEVLHNPTKYKEFLTGSYGKVFAGKAAVLAHPRFGLIDRQKFEALGLDYSKINEYITEAQEFNM